MTRHTLSTAATFALAVLVSTTVSARWAIRPTSVPVERLLVNTKKHIEAKPEDPHGYYVLGRLHSMAFASVKSELTVAGKLRGADDPKSLPGFLPYQSVKEPLQSQQPDWKLDGQRLAHLAESVRNYRKAVRLATKTEGKEPAEPPQELAKILLGMAWMYESADALKDEIASAGEENALGELSPADRKAVASFLATKDKWREQALTYYQSAFSETSKRDLDRRAAGPAADSLISVDAAQSIVRIIGDQPRDEQERRLKQSMQTHVESLSNIPRAVTPIIFSRQPTRGISELLRPDHLVSFDLDGDGDPSVWPWLQPDTWLLVWDPQQTGKVKDGRQLFGSSTWWIQWRHGYAPLALLDDDGNGWLTGAELQGLGGWRDANGDGQSNAGEVVAIQELGVVRIAVHPESQEGGIHQHRRGIEFRDAGALPTYDWTPSSRSVSRR